MAQAKAGLGPLQLGIIGLTAATALIHIQFLFPETMFILNGLGYLALLAALYFVPQLAEHRRLVRLVLLGYTAVTVVLWALIELALIALLWVEDRQVAAGRGVAA